MATPRNRNELKRLGRAATLHEDDVERLLNVFARAGLAVVPAKPTEEMIKAAYYQNIIHLWDNASMEEIFMKSLMAQISAAINARNLLKEDTE